MSYEWLDRVCAPEFWGLMRDAEVPVDEFLYALGDVLVRELDE